MTSSSNSKTAAAQPTHEVDILGFIDMQNIPNHHFGAPFTLTPTPGGEQSYKALHETLDRTRKVGLVYVKIQSRKQLAVLVTCGDTLQLKALRCVGEASLFGDAHYAGSDSASSQTPHAMDPGWSTAGMTGDAAHFNLPGLRMRNTHAAGSDHRIELGHGAEVHGTSPSANRANSGRPSAYRALPGAARRRRRT